MVDTTFPNKDVEFVSTYSHIHLGVILKMLVCNIKTEVFCFIIYSLTACTEL